MYIFSYAHSKFSRDELRRKCRATVHSALWHFRLWVMDIGAAALAEENWRQAVLCYSTALLCVVLHAKPHGSRHAFLLCGFFFSFSLFNH